MYGSQLKRLLKKVFFPVLDSRPVTSITDRLFNCGVPIFMLHRIANDGQPVAGMTDPEHLRLCLDYLYEHNYRPISLEQLLLSLHHKEPIPPKSVVFTMDDGYTDQADIASPIFLEYECPLTFFVITGMLDQTVLPWDAQVSWIVETSQNPSLENCRSVKDLGLSFNDDITRRELRRSIQNAIKKLDARAIPEILEKLAEDADVMPPESPPEQFKPMTWDSARQLEQRGIRFAPHSVTHQILSKLSKVTMETEIGNSWTTIQRELSDPLKVFCYPNGQECDFGEREIEFLDSNGFLGAVATTPNFVKPKKLTERQLFCLPRLALPDNLTDFVQYCMWIEHLRVKKAAT